MAMKPLSLPSESVIREEISKRHPVTIIFSTSDKDRKWYHRLASWIIRKFLETPYSHALISFYVSTNDKTPKRYVLEAESQGVWRLPFDKWLGRHNKVIREYFVKVDLSKALEFASENFVGIPYDFKGAGLSGLYRWIAHLIRHKYNTPMQMFCSELVLRIFEQSTFQLLNNIDKETEGPNKLEKRLQELPEYFERIV